MQKDKVGFCDTFQSSFTVQSSNANANRMPMGVGTPQRILELFEDGRGSLRNSRFTH